VRRWRFSTAAALIAIGMLIWAGSATSTPAASSSEEQRLVEEQAPPPPPVLLPWPDGCWSPEGGTACEDPEVTDPAVGTKMWRPKVPPEPKGWESLLSVYFRAEDVGRAWRVIKCESGGDPNAVNRNSGAAGLFQHLPRYWRARAASAGFAGASPLSAEANIAASAWLVYHGGGWSHWASSASCWR
jgi:hypothetical protein